jgi:hypothetical protein
MSVNPVKNSLFNSLRPFCHLVYESKSAINLLQMKGATHENFGRLPSRLPAMLAELAPAQAVGL